MSALGGCGRARGVGRNSIRAYNCSVTSSRRYRLLQLYWALRNRNVKKVLMDCWPSVLRNGACLPQHHAPTLRNDQSTHHMDVCVRERDIATVQSRGRRSPDSRRLICTMCW